MSHVAHINAVHHACKGGCGWRKMSSMRHWNVTNWMRHWNVTKWSSKGLWACYGFGKAQKGLWLMGNVTNWMRHWNVTKWSSRDCERAMVLEKHKRACDWWEMSRTQCVIVMNWNYKGLCACYGFGKGQKFKGKDKSFMGRDTWDLDAVSPGSLSAN